ncbi:NAD(P)H-dependent glycerol-3-phosphate dehydrogenase [Phorcysia thermohydrogeniphila]|uniref:Glycerol-3-phosphate dehydrogenase [NAD(P)+] n=1 Tax=Phorcysia thermohydrogeniphila TaxID=936138 RepID=A0A4R1GK72_9BACT|nr:NAD(P)H-dependent glycerol-3-phosphate dehydrogenase [Phorcysia thermohydrogeniphila]TCK06409.1 glycerol-3-phosphate dehydrogenase (NAD(P)+) [Phorcysia thermohydrogeniphila]
MKLSILGSGSWGSALAVHFGRNGFSVIQWCREPEISEEINKKRENSVFLEGVTYPESVRATNSPQEAIGEADVVLSVIPTQFTADFWKKHEELLRGKPLICASKGIDVKSLKTLSQIYFQIFGACENYFVLSGPTFAKEIASGLPAAAVIAGIEEEKTLQLVKALNTKTFRFYASGDVLGVELGGALKNVIAIATGIADGMGLGNNARAALITRGLHEIRRLGKAMGAKEETFYGLSGVGDLVLTCTGNLSRNRQFGLSIGRGEGKVDEKYVVEGVYTVKAVHQLSRKLKVEMPISEAVYKVIYEGRKPVEVMEELLSRPVKEENC